MTKLFNSLFIVAALSATSFAQKANTETVSDRKSKVENVDRVMKASVKVETRAIAINTLGLTAEEITGFDPLYLAYSAGKEDIKTRRSVLVDRYKKEMAEDDTAKDEENETADFIENLMELDIATLKLEKNMFDRFEDVIGAQRALEFFAMESMFTNRAKRNLIVEALPTMRFYVPVSSSYQDEVDAFRNWNKVNIAGKVGVDHNFTYNGLEKLLTAADKMTRTEGIKVADFASRKTMIMDKATKLKKDWKSLNHADLAAQAFKETADLMADIAKDSRFDADGAWISKLSTIAGMINVDKKLTDQASTVYRFFNTAEMIVNDLVDQAKNSK